MSELWKIVLTAIFTIVGGTMVYAGGRFLVALFVEPIHRLRSVIGDIADSLIFYAPVYGNPGVVRKEIADEAAETLRRQASQLRARAYSIPWYSLWAFMRLVGEKAKIEEASSELIGLSNSVHGGPGVSVMQNIRMERRIKELLAIQSSKKQKQGQPINSRMLSHGILLFFFGLILLAVKQQSTPVIFGFEIPTFPLGFYRAFGVVAIVMSVLFMIAVFQKRLAAKLEKFLEERPRSRWQGGIQWLFWVVLLFVYMVGWLKGFSSIPVEGFAYWVAVCIGFVWFCIFCIIPIVWFKVIFQRRK